VGLGLTVVAAVLIALDMLLPAGLVLLLAGSMDILDGAVARVSGRTQRYGAFLDSTADRYGEGAIYLGLLYLLLIREHQDLQASPATTAGSPGRSGWWSPFWAWCWAS
jgi:phosphatidylglycerophosphate synthase